MLCVEEVELNLGLIGELFDHLLQTVQRPLRERQSVIVREFVTANSPGAATGVTWIGGNSFLFFRNSFFFFFFFSFSFFLEISFLFIVGVLKLDVFVLAIRFESCWLMAEIRLEEKYWQWANYSRWLLLLLA